MVHATGEIVYYCSPTIRQMRNWFIAIGSGSLIEFKLIKKFISPLLNNSPFFIVLGKHFFRKVLWNKGIKCSFRYVLFSNGKFSAIFKGTLMQPTPQWATRNLEVGHLADKFETYEFQDWIRMPNPVVRMLKNPLTPCQVGQSFRFMVVRLGFESQLGCSRRVPLGFNDAEFVQSLDDLSITKWALLLYDEIMLMENSIYSEILDNSLSKRIIPSSFYWPHRCTHRLSEVTSC